MIATNAQSILDARLRGFKPSELIVISLNGSVHVKNHVTLALTRNEYDWRWVRDLDICLYIDSSSEWARTLKAIALCRPAHLNIWNPADQWGARVYLRPTEEDIECAKPVALWEFELDFLPWLDFQNNDFSVGRTYARTPEGMPYALDS